MTIRDSEIDADFYNLIHQLAGSAEDGPAAERRGDRRQPFRSAQRIAIRRGPGIPDESQFIEVRCHDLTRRGFSFVLPSQPDFDSLVAAFGTPPEVIYVAARVAHCDDVLVYSSGLVQRVADRDQHVGHQDRHGRTATPVVLVGCRFTERLHK